MIDHFYQRFLKNKTLSSSSADEGHVFNISEPVFEHEVLQSPLPVLVDFWAEWCGPCKNLSPTFSQLSKDYAGKVKFCKVNVDQSKELAGRYGVRGIPALLLFHKGQKVGESIGNVPRTTIEDLFKKSLSI